METQYRLSARAAQFYQDTFVPALFGPWAQRLVAAADLHPGQAVLDVACGTGAVTRAAAELAGPTVVGLDANPAMLAVARRLRPDLDWRVGDAHALPFGDRTFDRVLCQAALMFFADPVAALREMGRVGGRVAVSVPGRLSHSAGYAALTGVVTELAGDRAAALLGSYFAMGEPALLRSLWAGAGMVIERFESEIGATRLPSLSTFLDAELLPIAGEVDPDVWRRIEVAAEPALSPYLEADGSVAAPIEAHVITGIMSR
jgi:SAM-dependent methyltransferase